MNRFAEMAGGHGTAARGGTGAVPAVGDYVQFGHYPQTADGDSLPIEWMVLEADGEAALLISRHALDCQPYDAGGASISWERCTLRIWLNGEFYSRAFDAEERKSLLKSDVRTDEEAEDSVAPGSATRDYVLLLSLSEAKRYFERDEARWCTATPFAIQQGVGTDDDDSSCRWWLRSPSQACGCEMVVMESGDVDEFGCDPHDDDCGVRPCVRVRLSDLTRVPRGDSKREDSRKSSFHDDRAAYGMDGLLAFVR